VTRTGGERSCSSQIAAHRFLTRYGRAESLDPRREDPRTVLTLCVVVLVVGVFGTVAFISDGGALAVVAVVWLVVAIGQLVWAWFKFRDWRSERES
jgi:hypothetical protein